MRDTFLPFSPPLIGDDEINEVVDALRSGWITTGPKTNQFERDFTAYLGAPGALALNSCTAALHVGLVASGIGPGDEVITTTNTFTSTANVVEHVGASLVLVDVEPDTLNMNPECVASAITPRTRAIMPVHYSGHPVDMDPIWDLAHGHGLAVIEDAAHALPARYKGRYIGSGTNPAAFSFYATKNLTTGEGGMLTGSVELLSQARMISLHGMSHDAWRRYDNGGSWYYEVEMSGFKYNMGDIQAALGLAQLRRLEAMQARRREIVAAYNQAFQDDPVLQIPACRPDVEHAWQLYVLRLNLDTLSIDRARFIRELADRNIATSVHFIPVHIHPYYARKYGFSPDQFPVAFSNYQRMISLPLTPKLTDGDVADVIEAVFDVIKSNRI